jgi:hypothetical protein
MAIDPQLQSIVDRVADDADDLLAEASDRAQARAAIEEHLTAGYPRLTAAQRKQIILGVMAILEREDFFPARGGANVWDEEVAGEQ